MKETRIRREVSLTKGNRWDELKTNEEIKVAKEKVLDATIRVFNEKGLKFTMDDIAAEVSMSKKTIYVLFEDKQSLFMEMVSYCFDGIKRSEEKVLQNDQLSTVEKLRGILGVLPESYSDVNFSLLYELREKYPEIYEAVENRLENGWENTIELLERGMKEGVIRPINVALFKTVFEATLEQFFKRDVLVRNNITYADALREVVDILVDGIRA
ncbi:MAG: TetR/AcrR family transcriptional regulator [Lachnospiraceae bacterium]|nr:TetR/AcrR family transcriptional regulator [Lachnospiraceae bacterium]